MQSLIETIITEVGRVVLGKERQIRLAVACLLARGHLLIEDLPGMGKTTLAHSLAVALGLKYDRVQFTSDLLPTDILGVSVFDREASAFVFHPGPIFTELLLADEINRSTPKTQSALLEAMEERQVSIEGLTRALPDPFFVIATQNPAHQSGTFPLPESQLDRFLMRITLGYPGVAAERALLSGEDPREKLNTMQALVTKAQLKELQAQVGKVHVSEAVLDYLQRLVAVTREDGHFHYGLSPRGAKAWLRAASAWAMVHKRDYVIPEDIQAVLPVVVGHRVRGQLNSSDRESDLCQYLLRAVDVMA